MKIEELDLSVRSYHCLKRAGIDTVEQLKVLTDDDLARLRSIGPKCIEEIRQKVSALGMTNADRFRSMTDEALAELFSLWCTTTLGCEQCPLRFEDCPVSSEKSDWLKWLRQM